GLNGHQQVPWNSVPRCPIALARNLQLHAILNPGRDFDRYGLLFHLQSLGIRPGGPMVDDLSAAPTVGTMGRGLHPAQNGIGDLGDLPAPVAVGTGFIGYPFGLDLSPDLDVLFTPLGHFFQAQLDPDPKIAPLHSGLPSTKAAKAAEAASNGTAEDISELAENVLHVHAAPSKTGTAVEGCMPVLVIPVPLVPVAQYFIGLGRLLEHFLRLGIPRVLVRMELNRLFAIGLFYFSLRCSFGNPQYFVKILLHKFLSFQPLLWGVG